MDNLTNISAPDLIPKCLELDWYIFTNICTTELIAGPPIP